MTALSVKSKNCRKHRELASVDMRTRAPRTCVKTSQFVFFASEERLFFEAFCGIVPTGSCRSMEGTVREDRHEHRSGDA
jgi:hypothetical protein